MLECCRRWLGVPILIEGGKNVEYGEDVGDVKVYVSDSKVSPGTNPKSVALRVVWS